MAEASLTPIPRLTITDQIVERITAFILDERLRPGDKLPSERELMVRLGVGRSSLREAIKTLSAIGIVVVQIGDGMYVGSGQAAALTKPLSWGLLISNHTVREVIEARLIVETELAALAAIRASEEELAAMHTQIEVMRCGRNDAEIFTASDQAFHMAVASGAHNGVLYHMLETLRHVVRVWIFKTYMSNPVRYDAIPEHEAIIAAIAAHDPEAARAAMAQHLNKAATYLLNVLTEIATADPAAQTATQTAMIKG